MISEIYPLKVRGAAMSVATVANWGFNLVVAVTFLTLIGVLGHSVTFWLYGAIAAVAWVVFYRLVPETKGKVLNRSKSTGEQASIHEKWKKRSAELATFKIKR